MTASIMVDSLTLCAVRFRAWTRGWSCRGEMSTPGSSSTSPTNFIEIDLVRKGQWVFSADEALFSAGRRSPYMVCVFRATDPDFRAFYPMPLRQPLPRIAIPLRPHDRDVALDLQEVLDEAYETG